MATMRAALRALAALAQVEPLAERLYASLWVSSIFRAGSYPLAMSTVRRFGVPGRIRTCDPLLRRQPLCPLSYGDGDETLSLRTNSGGFTVGSGSPFLACPFS